MENFGKFMTIILVVITAPIISGFVIMKLWGWFIVTTFEMNPLRLVEAIGLMFLINYIKLYPDNSDNSDGFWFDFASNIMFIILSSGFVLLGGWIIQSFI